LRVVDQHLRVGEREHLGTDVVDADHRRHPDLGRQT
jgi:hypothetical protein